MKNILLGLILVFLVGCTTAGQDTAVQGAADAAPAESGDSQAAPGGAPSWLTAELKDVNSGETFKLSDFKGKPVLVESFAVWCPLCTKQQQNTKILHDEVGDDIVSVALDTDPNEDEARVKSHAESNGFDWHYSVAPTDLTKSLIAEFGNGIVNAPSVPMVLICPDGNYRQLGRGVKSVDTLKSEVARGCL